MKVPNRSVITCDAGGSSVLVSPRNRSYKIFFVLLLYVVITY